MAKRLVCEDCGHPISKHCDRNLVPCCPGKCSLDKETKDGETQHGRAKGEKLSEVR